MFTRETKQALREALKACGDAEKLARAADCLASFNIKVDTKRVQQRLEVLAHYEARIAEVVEGLDELDLLWIDDAQTTEYQNDLVRIRSSAYAKQREQRD